MWFVLMAFLAQSVDFQAEGIKALDAKQYSTAVSLFTQAVAADPQDYSAHFHLALAYSLLDKDADAIPEYKTALQLKPGLFEAELNLGICLLRVQDADAAIPYLKSAAGQRPKEFRPGFYLGQAMLDKGRYSEAEAAYTTALSLDSGSAAAEAGLGLALAREGKRADAGPHFRKAAALDPAYKDAWLQLAALYEENQEAAQAIAIYREFPENPGAQERMGALLIQTGDAGDAIPVLEAVVAQSPTPANRVALAQAYVKSKQPDKAAPLVAQAVTAEPRDYELRLFYGRLLRDQRKFNEAAAQFHAAAEIKPDTAEPWNELAGMMTAAEQYPEVITALDQVRALGAETSAHYYYRAMALDHLHQRKDALANYNKFLESSHDQHPEEEFKARQRIRIIRNELKQR